MPARRGRTLGSQNATKIAADLPTLADVRAASVETLVAGFWFDGDLRIVGRSTPLTPGARDPWCAGPRARPVLRPRLCAERKRRA